MQKYIEMGIGNPTPISSEIEWIDPVTGEEQEERVPGIVEYEKVESVYLRLWIGRWVWILDSKTGLKTKRKPRSAFKLILGLQCR